MALWLFFDATVPVLFGIPDEAGVLLLEVGVQDHHGEALSSLLKLSVLEAMEALAQVHQVNGIAKGLPLFLASVLLVGWV